MRTVVFSIRRQQPVEPSEGRGRRPIEERRAERELFFWTVQQALMLVLLAAFTVYALVFLIEGGFPTELLRYPRLPQLPG